MVCSELTAAAGCGEYVPAFSAFSRQQIQQ
jgi:hypothetical protein